MRRRRIITARYPGTCRDCGAHLPAGSRIRYYGRGRVYGVDCHSDDTDDSTDRVARAVAAERAGAPAGRVASILDPSGFYSADGTCLGFQNPAGRCEDAPCCGCCS